MQLKSPISSTSLLSKSYIQRNRATTILSFARFKSTYPIEHNDIQTSLPSLDDVSDTASTIIDQVSQNLTDTSMQLGYLQSLGMADNWYRPTDIIQHLLELTHVYTGLPWWGTIAALTIGIRLLLVPLYIKSSDTVAKNSRIKPQLDEINKKMFNATDVTEGQLANMERRKLMKENGIKNIWLVAPMVQLPIALGFFGALRHMANFPVEAFKDQGIAWFTDLTAADPYLGLQVITAAVYICFTRLGGETGAQQFSPTIKRLFTLLPLISIPATMKLSSAVVLYFAINGSLSVLQTTLLRNKWIRHKLNITDVVQHPVPESEKNKSMFQSMKDTMEKSREKAERREKMRKRSLELQEQAKEIRQNSSIRIVNRKSLKNKKK